MMARSAVVAIPAKRTVSATTVKVATEAEMMDQAAMALAVASAVVAIPASKRLKLATTPTVARTACRLPRTPTAMAGASRTTRRALCVNEVHLAA